MADGTSYISLNNQALLLFSTDADFVPNNGGFRVCATTGEEISVLRRFSENRNKNSFSSISKHVSDRCHSSVLTLFYACLVPKI